MRRNVISKALSLILAAVICISVTGCGSQGNKKGTNTTGNSAEVSGEVDTSEFVKLTYMTTGDKPTNNNTNEMLAEVNKILKEKVNAELEIYYIEWTDWLANYNLTLSQMDGSVDIIGTATDWADAWPNIRRGAFLELNEDLLKTYAPVTFSSISKEHWDLCKYEDDIYMIPEDNFAQWINHGFMYRMDWANEAGLTEGVHSWEELTEYLRYVIETYPDVICWNTDGKTHPAYGYIKSKSNYVPINGLGVEIFGTSKDDLKKVYSPFYEGDELIKYAELMKEWDSMGVWKTDVLNNNSQNAEDFYMGKSAIDQHHTETWYSVTRPRMDKEQPGSDISLFYFGEESKNIVKTEITHGALAISAASKNPERALMVADLLRHDPDIYRLFNYGFEGKQYVMVDEEQRLFARPEGYDDNLDNVVTNFWWGRNDDLALKDSKRAWEPYEKLVNVYEEFAIDYPYGQIVWETNSVSAQLSNLSDVYYEYIPKICYGKFDNAEQIVTEFREKLKNAGIEDVIKSIQTQVDDFYSNH